MQLSKEQLDRINAAVEADQIAFKRAAADLNLILNEGAISGRRQGYFKGYADAAAELSQLREERDRLRKMVEKIQQMAQEGIFPDLPVEVQGARMCIEIDKYITELLKTVTNE